MDIVVSVRFSRAAKGELDALVENERSRLRTAGVTPEAAARVAAADLLRALVREEFTRRGLVPDQAGGE